MPRPPRDIGSTSTSTSDVSRKLEKIKEKVKRKKREWKKWNKTLNSGKDHRVDHIEALGILYRLVALDIPKPERHQSDRWYAARQEAMDYIATVHRLSRATIRHYTKEDDSEDEDYSSSDEEQEEGEEGYRRNAENNIVANKKGVLWKGARNVADFMEKSNKHLRAAMLWLDIEHRSIMQELDQSRRNLRAFSNQKARKLLLKPDPDATTENRFVYNFAADADRRGSNSELDYDGIVEAIRRKQTDDQTRREQSTEEIEAFLQAMSEKRAREDAEAQLRDNDVNHQTVGSEPVVYSITGLRNRSEGELPSSGHGIDNSSSPSFSHNPALQKFMSKLKGTYEIKPGMQGFNPENLFNQYMKDSGIEIPEDFTSFEVLPAAGTGTVVKRGTIKLVPRSSIEADVDNDNKNNTKPQDNGDDDTTSSSTSNKPSVEND